MSPDRNYTAARAADQALDVSELLDRAPLGGLHWRVIGICGLILLIDGYDILAMAMIVPALAEQWHSPPASFALPLAACIAGVAFGSALAGRIADRVGRRRTLLGFLAAGCLATAATVFADSHAELTLCRFLTGAGLGGTIPLALALTAEYLPRRARSTLLTLAISAAPLGSAMASFLAPILIRAWDWRAVFVIGAIAPLIAFLLTALMLPESLRWLAAKGDRPQVLERLLRTIEPSAQARSIVISPQNVERSPLRVLLGAERVGQTMLLWLIFFASQFALLLLGSWLPTLLTRSGLSLDVALYATSTYAVGGMLSGLGLGWLSDRYQPQRVLAGAYAVATVSVAMLGFTVQTLPWLFVVAALAGAGIAGSQAALNAFAANFYPTAIRATGVGWALGVGRLGAIASPIIAGSMLANGWASTNVLLGTAISPLVCAFGIATFGRVGRRPLTVRNAECSP
jgi:MFS transporter, AAHS family, 4-hydroxybenzoate transporter